MNYLPKNLEHLREERKLNKTEMADLIGFNRSTYLGYENGDSNPTRNNLGKLAKFFNVSENDLLYKDLSEKNIIEEEAAHYDTAKAFKTEIKTLKEKIKLLTDHIDTLKVLLESRENEIRSLRDELKK